MKTSGNTILITGGGSGIGRELALRFNALGNTVIVAGRHMKTLEETIAGQQNMPTPNSAKKKYPSPRSCSRIIGRTDEGASNNIKFCCILTGKVLKRN